MNLQGKKVIVAGSGISGMGAVRLLDRLDAQIILYDGNEKLTEEEVRARLPEREEPEIVL